MSCSGCRVLRKGCSENCVLRPCLDWIETSDAQSNATVFVAKFFGRAALMSFISSVPENQRPAVFQSLLFEAAGRTVNPVNGALGLLWTGNWHICQAAVETVLNGGALRPISEFIGDASEHDNISKSTDMFNLRCHSLYSPPKVQKRRRFADEPDKIMQLTDLDLSLVPNFHRSGKGIRLQEDRRLGSPSLNSEESGVTTFGDGQSDEPKLLNLFN